MHAGTRAGSVCDTAGKPGRRGGGWAACVGGAGGHAGAERVVLPHLLGPCGCFVLFFC